MNNMEKLEYSLISPENYEGLYLGEHISLARFVKQNRDAIIERMESQIRDIKFEHGSYLADLSEFQRHWMSNQTDYGTTDWPKRMKRRDWIRQYPDGE